MQHVPNSDPRTFNCSSEEDEDITLTFTPIPNNCLGQIRYCFNDDCGEDEQEEVVGDSLTFTVDEDKKRIKLFFFFIPPGPGGPRGKCRIELSSSIGDTFTDPTTVKESITGIPFTRRSYIFKRI